MLNSIGNLKLNISLWIFVITFITAMFLPRLVQYGLFLDGLCYSSIARNLSIGIGSFWKPYFSSSFWLPYNTSTIFYEQPPLQFGIQAIFFKIFGDYWYVEKLYSLVVLITTLYIICKIWLLIFNNNRQAGAMAWLPLFLFYLIPDIIWAAPNNMLDSTMSVFTVAAAYFCIKPQFTFSKPLFNYILCGFFVTLAFLTKGFVGLFPIAITFIYYWVYKQKITLKSIILAFIPFITFLILLSVLLFVKTSRDFLLTYFNQQVFNAVVGAREHSDHELGHLYIVKWLFIQILPLLSVMFLLIIINYLIKPRDRIIVKGQKLATFFLLIGLTGSLPIMASAKQMALYLIPSLIFYAIAFAILILPVINRIFEKIKLNVFNYKFINGTLSLSFVAVLVYSLSIYGHIGREGELIRDMREFSKIIPVSSKIGVSPKMIKNGVFHVYLQRFYRYELTTDLEKTNYFIIDDKHVNDFSELLLNKGFSPVPLMLIHYQLFERI